MRNLSELDHWRVRDRAILAKIADGWEGDHANGVFILPNPSAISGPPLRIIASDGLGWDHVSVSLESRCPTWDEMEFVKRRFFKDNEIAIQFHVPPALHINCHPYCLHLWRKHGVTLELPPRELVA